jgi:hypothetical protein
MARGQKLVTLDFEFEYSKGGKFEKEFAVTLKAPSLDLFAVHNYHVSMAESVELGLAAKFSRFERRAVSDAERDAAIAKQEEAQAVETDDDAAKRIISQYASGMEPDAFASFVEKVKKTLTGNPKLATIGETTIPITDAVWDDIASKGGLDAVMQIIAGFLGFFDTARKSASPTGKNSRAGQPSEAAVH